MPHSTPDVQEHARGAAVTSVRQQARWRYGTSDEMATRTAAHDPAAITSRVGVSNPRLEAAR